MTKISRTFAADVVDQAIAGLIDGTPHGGHSMPLDGVQAVDGPILLQHHIRIHIGDEFFWGLGHQVAAGPGAGLLGQKMMGDLGKFFEDGLGLGVFDAIFHNAHSNGLPRVVEFKDGS